MEINKEKTIREVQMRNAKREKELLI